ncbi:hypothetical protein K443DRAFT_6476, partial [Laccaria amethystina LaAM-08-1]
YTHRNTNTINIVCKKSGGTKKSSKEVSVCRGFPAYEHVNFIRIHTDTFVINNATEDFYLLTQKIQFPFGKKKLFSS